MKQLLIFTAAFVLLAGCGDHSTPTPTPPASNTNSSGGSLVTAPVDYLNSAAKAQQRAVKTIDVTALTQAIQLFNVDKGRYPENLKELITEKYISQIPETPYGTKIEYDAATGTVKVVKQ